MLHRKPNNLTCDQSYQEIACLRKSYLIIDILFLLINWNLLSISFLLILVMFYRHLLLCPEKKNHFDKFDALKTLFGSCAKSSNTFDC